MNVKHTELLGPVLFSKEWLLSIPHQVNPGLAASFPKLSAIVAGNWEMYRFKGLKFIFEPSKGTQRDGLISMAADFDWNDSVPENLTQMSQKPCYVSGVTWEKLVMDYKQPSNGHKKRFVRSGPIAMDPNETDVGTFYVSLSDSTSADIGSACGYLYASYDVDFYKLDAVVANTIGSLSTRAEIQTAVDFGFGLTTAPTFFGDDTSASFLRLNPNRMGLEEYTITGIIAKPKRRPKLIETKDGFELLEGPVNAVLINGFILPTGWFRLEAKINVSFTAPITYTVAPTRTYFFVGTVGDGSEITESIVVQCGSGAGDNFYTFYINCVYLNQTERPLTMRFVNDTTATDMTVESGYLLITAQ